MTTATTTLSREQRAAVFDEILRELAPLCPDSFDVCHDLDPGGLVELYGHLDQLVEIVRRTTAAAAAGRVEPYIVQVREHVCSTCPHQLAIGFCPLRFRNTCVLSAYASRIARAIGRALYGSRYGPSPERGVKCSSAS
jgi:hypothetical protein